MYTYTHILYYVIDAPRCPSSPSTISSWTPDSARFAHDGMLRARHKFRTQGPVSNFLYYNILCYALLYYTRIDQSIASRHVKSREFMLRLIVSRPALRIETRTQL